MFKTELAKDMIQLFAALGLRVNIVPTNYEQLEPNDYQRKDSMYAKSKQDTIHEFEKNHWSYTVIIELNLSGYMTVLEEFGVLAQMQGTTIGARTAFILTIFQYLLPENLTKQVRFLMNVAPKDLDPEGNLE